MCVPLPRDLTRTPQGFVAEALRDIVVKYVCRDRADHLLAFRRVSCMQNGPSSGSPNSESRMADGRWRVVSGEWRVASGEWRVNTDSDQCPTLVSGDRSV